jgi:hypothetical protein
MAARPFRSAMTAQVKTNETQPNLVECLGNMIVTADVLTQTVDQANCRTWFTFGESIHRWSLMSIQLVA